MEPFGPLVMSPGETVHLLEQELALTNSEVLALTVELDKRIEELRGVEIELRESLAEKTTLLQEVHHRVRNNLQIICSMLSMQIDRAGGDSFSGPLNATYQRVLTMATIHEQLVRSDSFAHLDFGGYIRLLSDRLCDVHSVDATRIRFELNVEAIQLSMDEAMTCGLILNELLTNSLRHAFDNGQAGAIRIAFKRTKGGYVKLTIADEGVGWPANFQWQHSRSLGLTVVQGLIAQLGADFAVSGAGGVAFTLTWKPRS